MTRQESNRTPSPAPRRSLATQLIWVSILMVTLAVAAVGTGLILIAERMQRESAFRLQQKTAEQVSQLISNYMTRAVDRLSFFLKTTPLWYLSPDQQKDELENLLIASLPLYSQISLLNRDGNELVKVSRFHTFLPEELKDQSKSPSFMGAMEGDVHMGPVALLEKTGLLSVSLSMPIASRTSAGIVGVIVAEVNVSHLWQKVVRIEVGQTGYAYLVDRNGRFVAYQKPAEILQRYGEDMRRMPPVTRFVRHGHDGMGEVQVYAGLLDEHVIGVHEPIEGTDWSVVVEQPTREAYAGIAEMKMYLAGLILLCIMAAGLIAFYVSRRLIRPIRTLTAAAQRLGTGDLETTFGHPERQDEVGILSQAFQKMQRELHGLYAGLRQNIEDLEAAHKALRESEAKYRTVLDSNPDPVVLYDMEGKVLYFNPAFTRVFGWTLEERIGKRMDDFVPEENWPETRSMIYGITVLGQSFSGLHTRRRTREGKALDISVSGAGYRDEVGNVVASVINLRDITEQKDLENRFQRAHKMESLGLMAGGVAHDLNNILSGIVSYPELLLMDLPEDSPLRKPILTIHESGQRAAEVVSDLLTIARGVAIGKEIIQINRIVTEYLASAEHLKLQQNHPSVLFKALTDAHVLNMRGSPVHLKKVVMNLVANAAEAISERGTVTISTLNRYLDEPLRGYDKVHMGEYVVLRVSDDGCGVSPENMERIFEPFYTKKVMGRSGTGLGLAVVWNTVQDHNGYVNVGSDDNGTVFELYFPVTREEICEDREVIPIAHYSGRGEKILIVDDEERQREIACSMLRKLGYDVEAVSSGDEAIDHVKEHPVDLIVLDMVMPRGINGRETYEAIIRFRPEQKAIVASGYAETEEVSRIQALGAGRFVKKPYTLESIGIAVREALEGRCRVPGPRPRYP